MLNLRHVFYMQSMGWGTSMIGNLGEPLDQRWYASSAGTSSDLRAAPSPLVPASLSHSDSPTFVAEGEALSEDADDFQWIPDDIELRVVR